MSLPRDVGFLTKQITGIAEWQWISDRLEKLSPAWKEVSSTFLDQSYRQSQLQKNVYNYTFFYLCLKCEMVCDNNVF